MQSKNTRHFSDERFKINTEEMLKDLEELINTPSVVGFYPEIHKKLAKIVGKMGYEIEYDNKRTAYVRVPGIDSSKTVCVGAHLDTIGLQVRHVMENGWIEVKNLGGINFHNVEGENVYIHTRNGKTFEGMVICKSHSVHVFDDARSRERDINNEAILLDADVNSAQDVYDLGIENGDLISVEPRFKRTKSGFIKSRHIDDKAMVVAAIEVLRQLKQNDLKPAFNTLFAFPIYEEIGHGGAYVPSEVSEYVSLDIGLIGPDNHGSEKLVSIGASDHYSPYDWGLTTHLINLAKENQIDYCVDTFYRFGSDATAAIRSGNNVMPAVFGVGCMNSHGYERTSIHAIEECARLTLAYVLNK